MRQPGEACGSCPPRVSVTRRVGFSAARQLASPALGEADQEALFGRDRHIHGHDFTLYVTLGGEAPPETGMVMDLKALSELLRREVVAGLDHNRLDGNPLLAGWPATSENLAVAIWRRIDPLLPPGSLAEVELWEGARKGVRYRGE